MGNGRTPGKTGGRAFAPSYAAFRQNGRLCEGIVRLSCKEQSGGKTAAYEEKFARQKDAVREREYAQVYRLTMQLLEQMMELLEGESMTLPEFREILEAGFGEIEVGSIPQNVDRVLVGDMERTRLKEVKVLFL